MAVLNQKTTENTKPAGRKKTGWLILAICVALLLAVAVGIVLLNRFTLELTLSGKSEVTLEWGTEYDEPGAQASFYGSLLLTKPESIAVNVHGSVDPTTLGVYELEYVAEKQLDLLFTTREFRQIAKRTVRVVDTVAPEIQLLIDPDYFTLPGAEYMEEGYIASDNHDGDLTASVQIQLHDDKIVYRVADMSGNAAEAVRQIVYSDPIAPQVLLEGKTEVIVLVGSAYEEPGYFAVDNLDGDITDRVVIQGTVDPQTMGTYHLQYTVTDSFGNAGTATRTVIVRDYPELPDNLFPGQAEEPVIPEGRVIYLTFDDGPCAYTNILLDILKKHNVKATFFVINRGYHDILRRIVAEGHTLGMHCGEHTYRKIYASEEAYFADLKEIQDTIYEQTGVISTIVRFPGGSSNAISKFNPGIMTRLTKMLKDMGYRYFDWNVGSGDAGGVFTKEDVFRNVVNGIGIHDISVVLQHDIKYFSIEAVEDIIKWGKRNGYTFLPLTNDSPVMESRVKN